MATPATISLSLDSAPFLAVFDPLLENISSLSPEIGQRVAQRACLLLESGGFYLEQLPTSTKREVPLRLQPTRGFVDFVAAVRAGNSAALR